MKITAIIVDDEQDSREILASYLAKYCPQVQLQTTCVNITAAKKAILKHEPDLVFLDIEMPYGNAFDLLEQFDDINFEIIFVTAFSQYAIQAFNLSAAHYLLKPLDIEELEQAVEKVALRISKKQEQNHAQILLDNIKTLQAGNRKLVLPLMEGFEVVRLSEILYCQADDNFTCFYFTNGKKALICRSLKHYEKTLDEFGFCRVHRSYMVNLEYVKRYIKGKGGSIILENGKEILVSNTKKATFIKRLREG